jgi:hypothetical protein
MNHQEDLFNVDDRDFAENLQEDKELATLFTEKALVEKGSFMLKAFMLLCLFSSSVGIGIRNIKNGADSQTATEKNFSDLERIGLKDD